jgi:hypothetical protein
MWSLDNHTPYAAERTWIRNKQGRHLWVVAVKATFDVRTDGRLALADEQPPPALAPDYGGEPGLSSLRWDSDLMYAKTGTDVIAEAQAHAPKGKPQERVLVALRVGPIFKQLYVYGPRIYYDGAFGLTTTPPSSFTRQPISYELAYGGRDLTDPNPSKHRIDGRNPVGRGFAVDSKHLVRQPAHQIEYLDGSPAKRGPAGFGPIDPAWSPRRERAGTYDAEWEKRKKPLLPDDYNELYGSCSPADQRVEKNLTGGERVEMLNLTPSGVVAFELPRIHLGYSTHFGSRREEHRGQLVTVLLRPEIMQVSLVWQTTLYVSPRDGDYLDVTRIWEKRQLT